MNTRFDPDQSAYYKQPFSNKSLSSYYSDDFERGEPSFFFYDLETSGINPREDRIMQFAGQRTSLDLEPLGDPVNI